MKAPGGYYCAVDDNIRALMSEKIGNWVISYVSPYTSEGCGVLVCCGF